MTLGFVLRLANSFRLTYWRMMGAITVGVRVIAYRRGEVFLVRSSYRNEWQLPGGGVKKGELLSAAAQREAYEEGGLHLTDVKLVGVFTDLAEGRTDHVVLFAAKVVQSERVRNLEIKASGFFSPHHLPDDLSPSSARLIREFSTSELPTHGPW